MGIVSTESGVWEPLARDQERGSRQYGIRIVGATNTGPGVCYRQYGSKVVGAVNTGSGVGEPSVEEQKC